ncbi:hypothetical protein CC80DRAFT_533721 [Byssothecium circinans]|uniref:AA1-like domain-containing protein n=1 Tax=Byssothecium circinans TaxID=147558 RepID=A0A6A5U0N3_9PLEO|nr:hypothetical protein CC80DRAFT_533721 [Byssothecium circinans]
MHVPIFLILFPLTLAQFDAPSSPNPYPAADPCDFSNLDNPHFQLRNVTYHSSITYSTPAHLAVSEATFEFTLSNTAPGAYSAQCKGQSSYQPQDSNFFNVAEVQDCYEADGATGEGRFIFSRNANGDGLGINQTWTCGTRSFLATGGTPIYLTCEHTNWFNSSFNLGPPYGGLYSTSEVICDPFDVDVVYGVVELHGLDDTL